jgi:hypothetical protein
MAKQGEGLVGANGRVGRERLGEKDEVHDRVGGEVR